MNTQYIQKQKFLLVILVSILFICMSVPTLSTSIVSANQVQYIDVPQSNTHYDNIMEANREGFMTGYPDGTFRPAASLSRGNVVKSLGKYIVKTSGKDLGNFDVSNVEPFTDIPPNFSDNELYQYSLIVKQAGVFTGDRNNLKPTHLITRQQMAKVLVNAFQLQAVPNKQSIVLDHHLALKEYRDSIDILSMNGVTVVPNFNPAETTTRAQFASFLMRSHKAGNSTGTNPVPDPNPTPDPDPDPDPTPDPDPDPDPDPAPDPGPTPDPVPISVEDLQTIYAFKSPDIELPKTVKVFYDDNSEKDHAVIWNKKAADLIVGNNTLTGKVAGTNFNTQLIINILPVLDVIIDVTIPDWVVNMSKAREIMNKLPQAIKNADNPADANLKIFEAMIAVNKVKGKNQSQEVTDWENEIDKQIQLVKDWKANLSSAIANAKHWLNKLAFDIKNSGDATKAQNLINETKLRVDKVVEYNKKYNTTEFMKIINEQQKVVNTMKELTIYANKLNPKIKDPNKEVPYFVMDPQTYSSTAKLFFTRDNATEYPVNNAYQFQSILVRRLWGFGSKETTISFIYKKDSVTVTRTYEVHIPSNGLFSYDPPTVKDLGIKVVVK